MNAQRRKQIEEAKAILESLKDGLQSAFDLIESITADEQEYKDNMPESMQDGEKGEKVSTAIDALEEASSAIESFDLDDIIGQLETAGE